MTGVAKKTVMRLLVEVGQVCESYQDRILRKLSCCLIQLDELWGFNYCKAKNVTQAIADRIPGLVTFGFGLRLDAETKLVPCWRLGGRDALTAYDFVQDLANRLSNRVQLTSDGHRVYLTAVEAAFGSDVDYAMLVKMYGNDAEADTRYSPAECIGTQSAVITGRPDPNHIRASAPRCGVTRDYPMVSRARSRTMRRRWRFTISLTISSKFTAHCALPRQWRQV